MSIENYQMRSACDHCESTTGRIVEKNGQDLVICTCGKYQYCAPRTETGRKARSLSTTHKAIKPKQRSRIIDRANGRCERCGVPCNTTRTGLHVGHVVSVKDGHAAGLSDAEINSDENLLAECGECNLGHGSEPIPLRIYIALISARNSREWTSEN